MNNRSRRSFLKTAVRGVAGLAILPNIMPRSLFAADRPSRRIHVAQIGCGREGEVDMSGILAHPAGRIVAVCDLDSRRLVAGKKLAEDFYKRQGESGAEVKTFHDYREVLAQPDIDAVVVTVDRKSVV
jgi:myo-inositol 2-dehydrogenase/D-chiro-inositol 1-dehydrogenase